MATFFARVAMGGAGLIRQGGWPRRRKHRDIAFIVEVARKRGLLFRDGPDDSGRYFGDDDVSEADIVGAVMRARPATLFRARRAHPERGE